jgi:hypothetical protein
MQRQLHRLALTALTACAVAFTASASAQEADPNLPPESPIEAEPSADDANRPDPERKPNAQQDRKKQDRKEQDRKKEQERKKEDAKKQAAKKQAAKEDAKKRMAQKQDRKKQDRQEQDSEQQDSAGVIVHDVAFAPHFDPHCPTCYPGYWTAGYLWPCPQPFPPGYTACYAAPFSSLACPVYDWPCGYGGFVGGHAGYAPMYPYAAYDGCAAWHPGYCGPVCLGW